MFGHTTPFYPPPSVAKHWFFWFFLLFSMVFWFFLGFHWFFVVLSASAFPKRRTVCTFGQRHCQNAVHSALLEYCISKTQYIRHFWTAALPKRNTFGTFEVGHCQIAIHSAFVECTCRQYSKKPIKTKKKPKNH